MKAKQILDWLEACFLPENAVGRDLSIQTRAHLIPTEVHDKISPSFWRSMSGCLTTPPNEIKSVMFATFLSEETSAEALNYSDGGTILIVHHLFDMHCGHDGEMDGKAFSFISMETYRALCVAGITLYAVHLPYDEAACQFNTSRRFAYHMGFSNLKPLNLASLQNVGYEVVSSRSMLSAAISVFDPVIRYGNIYYRGDGEQRVAIIAGVVSKPTILRELEDAGFDVLICGDALVRVPGNRYSEMERCLRETSLSVYCVSHLKSEEIALKDTADELRRCFPELRVCFLQEDTPWK